MAKITYPTKVENNGATAQGRFFAVDANEIKAVVNALPEAKDSEINTTDTWSSQKISDEIAAAGGGGDEITDSVIIDDFQDEDNWDSAYGADWEGSTDLSAVSVGSYFKGANIGTHTSKYLYQVIEVSTTKTPIRIPLQLL